MIRNGIASELRWFFLFFSLSALLGIALNLFPYFLSLGLLLYVARVIFLLRRLSQWMATFNRESPASHQFPGVWGELAEDVIRLSKKMARENNKLQSRIDRVQEMTSALTDGVLLIDAKGCIDWWNAAAENLIELKTADRGYKISNFIRNPNFIKYFDGGRYDEPLVLLSPHEQHTHLQYQVEPFGKGERIIVVRDVTRMFRLEQMRKDFVANVSHELRTPLTVVRGYLETLGDSPEAPASWARAFAQMQEQSRLMTALVNDLITLAKLETDDNEVHIEQVNIADMIETIVGDARALSGAKNQTFHRSGDEALCIQGCERELRSAFSNLIFNAVHYSPQDADISIEYHLMGGEAVVMVTDTGVGIDPKHIPRLTERFYRVDSGRSKASGGTGLGLAIVKHVLLRHEADLKIVSRLGVGSKFSCHFPENRLSNNTLP